MRSLSLAILAAILAAVFSTTSAHAASQHQTRRFSLIAGANDGGAQRVRLRYAGSDATSMAQVLVELGGVAPGDQLLLLDPDRLALQRALAQLTTRLEAARVEGHRVELFFYYSGHSDEEGLLLGEERFGYHELRQAIEALPADVRVAILDSCASGALTRRKGGVMRPPFLLDASSSVQGHAFLTASSADEAAQESDRIGASFFTHHLVSGLRGAADTSGRGQVTLNDAYTYAYRETLSTTERTQHGAQHPAYEMQLVGAGDLVITDLRAASAGLILDEALGGRIFIRDPDGKLVVEVRKLTGAPLELGLAPGGYSITLDEQGALFGAEVALREGRRERLGRQALRPVEPERTVPRGEATVAAVALEGGGGTEAELTADAQGEYQEVPFSSTLIPEPPGGSKTLNRFGLHLLGGRTTRLEGTQLSLGVNLVDESVEGSQIGLAGNFAGASVRGTQLAIGLNVAGGHFEGSQVAVGASFTGGSFEGFQGAVGGVAAGGSFEGAQLSVGMAAAGGDFEGLQGAVGLTAAEGDFLGAQLGVGLAAAGGDFEGLQTAVGVTTAGGALEGAQLAVGAAYAGRDLRGVQAAMGASVTGARLEGLQTAAFSYAREIDGLQLSFLNIAGQVEGSQIGFINIAGVNEGAQIGFLNFARESDVSIGLLSFVRNGRFDLELSANDVNVANLGIQLGTRYVYGILAAGLSPRDGDDPLRWTTGVGLGTRFGFDDAFLDFLDLDLTVHSVRDGASWESENFLNVLRLGAGWRLAPQLAIAVGPSLNVFTGFGSDRDDLELIPGWVIEGKHPVRIWPGFFAAVQI